jgi:hypothetical protein
MEGTAADRVDESGATAEGADTAYDGTDEMTIAVREENSFRIDANSGVGER